MKTLHFSLIFFFLMLGEMVVKGVKETQKSLEAAILDCLYNFLP